ncbi:MAG TPA: hypothetical protein VFO38_06000 [Candidatus Saccharimonadales bacterium]|nr:hypothetical protein [Candidatus Saccharimonadales bacterium]
MAKGVRKIFLACISHCGKMHERAGNLLAKLESDIDETTKIEKADYESETLMLMLVSMRGEANGKVDRLHDLCQCFETQLLECTNDIAGVATASLQIAEGLGEDVVSPVRITYKLAKQLADNFFQPGLDAAEAAKAPMAEVVEKIDAVGRPRGSDVQSFTDDFKRFMRDVKALEDALKLLPVETHMKTVLSHLEGSKQVVGLLDD